MAAPRPKQETEFVHTVRKELEQFLQINELKSVLVFPPLLSRFRYLIHQITLNHPELSTFSVGDGCSRRVVVCHSDLRLLEEDLQDAKGSFCERANGTSWRKYKDRRSQQTKPNNKTREKRPDKAVYVPRAVRQNVDLNPPNLVNSSKESDFEILKDQQVGGSKVDTPDEVVNNNKFVQLSKSGSPPWPEAWDQTVSFLLSYGLDNEDEKHTKNTLLPTDGAQHKEIDEDLLFEIKAKLIDGNITVLNTSSDFSSFTNVWLDAEEFGHIIEIYDFPAVFKTEDLVDAFVDYSSEGGMKIKWVDNTHALGIFSDICAATRALSINHTLLKTRSLLDGSDKAKWKASRNAEFMLPVKERPHTDTAVAHRMVSRALGLRGKVTENHNS